MEAQRGRLQQLGGTSKERSHGEYCLEEESELLICQAGTSVCSGIEQTSLWKLVEAGRPRGNQRDTGTVAAQGDSTQPPLSKGGVPWDGGPSFSHMGPTIELPARASQAWGNGAKETPLSTFLLCCISAYSTPHSSRRLRRIKVSHRLGAYGSRLSSSRTSFHLFIFAIRLQRRQPRYHTRLGLTSVRPRYEPFYDPLRLFRSFFPSALSSPLVSRFALDPT